MSAELLDGGDDRFDGAVGRVLGATLDALDLEKHARERLRFAAALELHVDQLVDLFQAEVFGHQGVQVLVVDGLLAVAELLEAVEGARELGVIELVAERAQPIAQGRAT